MGSLNFLTFFLLHSKPTFLSHWKTQWLGHLLYKFFASLASAQLQYNHVLRWYFEPAGILCMVERYWKPNNSQMMNKMSFNTVRLKCSYCESWAANVHVLHVLRTKSTGHNLENWTLPVQKNFLLFLPSSAPILSEHCPGMASRSAWLDICWNPCRSRGSSTIWRYLVHLLPPACGRKPRNTIVVSISWWERCLEERSSI